MLRGYRRLPGSARKYLTPSGKEISRYEYDSRVARLHGFKNRGELERLRQTKEARAWRFKTRAAGNTVDLDFYRALSDLRADRDAGRENNAADGPLAQLLAAIGARDPDWDWAVGETPKGVKA